VYQREFGARAIAATDRLWLAEWLEKNSRTNEVYNRHRERLIDLWAYFISRGYATTNEAEATLKRSMSKKLEGNQKVRKRLELEGFWQIYNHADCPRWLQVAMELSLVTLQARKEIVAMQYHDIRNGYLHVIRDKTAADTDMAFIRIAVDDTLAGIVARSRQDGLVSPFMVHHKPVRKRKEYIKNKAHWTQVQDDYLSRAFSALRDKTGLWDSLKPPERPTFHEIRSLGARTYMKAGYDKSYVQALMTHTTPKTTDVYLSGGEITDDMYQTVTAGLIIKNPGL
jgi:integrase